MKTIKPASVPFTRQMLPQNRRQVYWDVMKLHWRSFLAYGVLLVVFAAPGILFNLMEDLQVAGLTENFAQAENQEAIHLQVAALRNTHALLNVPCILLLAVYLSGMIRVIRQHGWIENVFFSADFGKGVRQNLLHTGAVAVIVSVIYVIAAYCWNLLALSNSQQISMLLVIPMAALVFVALPIAGYALVCIGIYSNRLSQNLLTGFALMAKHPLKTLAVTALCLLPFAVQLLPNLVAHLLGGILGCMCTPFLLLAWFLHTSDLLDRDLNHKFFPELVGRGTFPPEQESE